MEIAGSKKNHLPAISPLLIGKTINWLQKLLEKQLKSPESSERHFDVKSYLHYIDVPPFNEILNSETELCRVASLLIPCNEGKITLIGKPRKITRGCSEIHVEVDGNSLFFYIKKSWEGAIKEALGIEFNNLLTDVPQRYLCGKEIIVTERVFEPLYPENIYLLKESPQYAFAYGAWEVFTTLLHITDRKIKNVRWNGEKLANIDFGLVFYRGELTFDSRLAVPRDSESYRRGVRCGLNTVLQRIHGNRGKLKKLLLGLDSSFCRTLPCHRHPVAPLKIMINTLKELAAEDFLEALDPVLKKEEADCGPLDNGSGCFDGLQLVEGHIASSIFTTNGEILAQKSLPGYRFETICPLVVKIVNKALLSVAQAGLGKCNFVQVGAEKGVLFAMWAIEEKLIIASLFDIAVIAGQAKMEMLKAVKKFVPLYEKSTKAGQSRK
jgi:predicted regulator of Ras-like GTPase activity (Roadblock/LC7/MglB family)